MKNPLQLVDKRALVILIGITVILTLAAVIVIVTFMSIREREALEAEAERREREEQALSSSTNFGIEDFYLDIREPNTGIVYPARTPRRTWTSDEVEFYWINPGEAGIDTLSEDNDEEVLKSLGVETDRGNP